MSISKDDYSKMTDKASPNSPIFLNCLKAFIIGGLICTLGQLIMELLKTLKDNNMKVGVVSNKFDRAVKELCKDYFGDLIDIAVGEREGIAKKPAPDSVFEALRILDSKKECVLYIGDSDTDMETAKNAGVDSIGVTWGFRDREVLIETGAKYIVEKPLDILEISKI